MNGIAGISIVIPAFNEVAAVARQIEEVDAVMSDMAHPYEIIVVDDGSTDGTAERVAGRVVQLIRRDRNYGYGSALKTGIAAARFDWILIVDADQTYPSTAIPALLERVPDADMVVGARTGKNVYAPFPRRGPKWLLRQYASGLAGRRIPDLNSGMRIMRKEVVERFLDLLPSGFSFTTTITLSMISNGYQVVFVPIDYFKRVGRSKIRPADFFRIFALITRLMLLFRPARLLGILGLPLLLLGFLAWRYAPPPVHLSTAGFAGVSGCLLGLAGLVEYRSRQLRIPRVNPRIPSPVLLGRITGNRGLRILGSVVLLLLLAVFLPRERMVDALRSIHLKTLLCVLSLLLLTHTASSWKWHLLVNEGGAGLPFASSMRLYFSGLFGNLFLPSVVGGDAVTIALGLRETRCRAAVVLGTVVNRVLDMTGLLIIALMGAAAMGGTLNVQGRKLVGAALAASVAVVLLSVFLLRAKRLPGKLKELVSKHQSVIDAMRRPRTYAVPFALSVVVQLSFLFLVVWIAETSGLHIGFALWFLAWPLAKFVALLPISTGGIGSREIALAALLAPFGVPAAPVVAVALAWDGVLIGGGLMAGLISRVLARNATPARVG